MQQIVEDIEDIVDARLHKFLSHVAGVRPDFVGGFGQRRDYVSGRTLPVWSPEMEL